MIDGLEVGGGDGNSSRLRMMMRRRVSTARRVIRNRSEAAVVWVMEMVGMRMVVWSGGGVIRGGYVESCRIEWVGLGRERA